MYGSLSLAPPLLYWKGNYLSPGRTHTRHPLFMHLSLLLAPSASFPIAYLLPTRTLTRYPSDSISCPKAKTDLVTLIQGAWPQMRIRPPFMFLFLFLYLSSLLVISRLARTATEHRVINC